MRLVRLLESGEILRRIEGKLDGIGARRNDVERRLSELEGAMREVSGLRLELTTHKAEIEALQGQMARRRDWQEGFWKRTFITGGAVVSGLAVILGGLLWIVRYAPHAP